MSERIVAIVPVRSLRNGKTRLSPVLPPAARERLLRQAAERVVSAAVDSGVIETVLVVSPSPDVLAWAADLGGQVAAIRQPDHLHGLNGAIEAGREWARRHGAEAMVSLFADLPLIGSDDIRSLTVRPEAVVLGPDRRGEGTNALLLRLDGRGREFRFAFGERSLFRHLEEARRLGLDVSLHDAAGIGFDLDTPDDWADFLEVAAGQSSLTVPQSAECEAGVG